MKRKKIPEYMRCAKCERLAKTIYGGTYWDEYVGVCERCFKNWGKEKRIEFAIYELRKCGVQLLWPTKLEQKRGERG